MRIAEGIARFVYDWAQAPQAHPPGPGPMLLRLVGRRSIVFGETLDVRQHIRGWRVVLPSGLSSHDLCMASGRALGWLGALSSGLEIDEALLDECAMAIVMPALAVRAIVAIEGATPAAISEAFIVDLDVAATRLKQLGIGLASGKYESGRWRSAG